VEDVTMEDAIMEAEAAVAVVDAISTAPVVAERAERALAVVAARKEAANVLTIAGLEVVTSRATKSVTDLDLEPHL